MWVFEETLPSGEKLSDVINQKHVNLSYLNVVVHAYDMGNSLDDELN